MWIRHKSYLYLLTIGGRILSINKIIGIIIIIIVLLCILVQNVNEAMYTKGIYDCSNMCTDQEYVMELMGLDVDIAANYTLKHGWLIINTPLGPIHWEAVDMTV